MGAKYVYEKNKKTLQPLIVDDKIIFGLGNSKIERSIENNSKNLEIINKLSNNLYCEDNELLKEFEKKGLITINDYDNSRFSRNINFFEWIDTSENINPNIYQDKLINSKVLIVGLGGLGGTVSELLVRAGVGSLILVNFDVVEDSNITRQSVYIEESIGKYKLDECEKYLKSINKDLIINKLNKNISTKYDLEEIFNNFNFDIAICSADKPKFEIDMWFDDVLMNIINHLL